MGILESIKTTDVKIIPAVRTGTPDDHSINLALFLPPVSWNTKNCKELNIQAQEQKGRHNPIYRCNHRRIGDFSILLIKGVGLDNTHNSVSINEKSMIGFSKPFQTVKK